MVTWLCDICGAPGVIHPKTEPVMEEKVIRMEVPDPNNPTKSIIREITKDVPVTTTIRRQNTQTSRVETLEIGQTKDLQPRAVLVSLNFGMENVQKDFCKDCFDSDIKEHVDKLFDILHKIQDR